MAKKIRLLFLSSLIILFFVFSPILIFYSQGYRFDFNKKRIVKTGGLNIKAFPVGAEVYLNDKLIGKTNIIITSVFIQNLLPKKYNLIVKKEGYLPWEKKLEVQEKEVTKAEDVILFPEKVNLVLFEEKLENFFFLPDKKNLILKESSSKNFRIVNLQNLSSDYFLKNTATELLDLKLSSDSKKIVLKLLIGGEERYFLYDLKEKTLKEIDFLKKTQFFSFDPGDSNIVFFIKNKILFKQNLQEKKPQKILENLLTFSISDSNIFWLSKDGLVIKSEPNGKTIEVLNKKPFQIDETKEYFVDIFLKDLIFLKENKNRFYLNKERVFEKLFSDFKDLKISPDFKKILVFSNHEIWLVDPDGEKTFLNRFSENIGDCFWLTPNYLIFNFENKIKIMEIDNRDRLNLYDLNFEVLEEEKSLEIENLKIFFNEINKKLYLLTKENLYSSSPLF